MAKLIVADTSPLIALARIDRLSLLESFFEQVLVPQIVAHEWMGHEGLDAERLTSALGRTILAVPATESVTRSASLLRDLDIGEAYAVALAAEMTLPILVDDMKGRKAAKRLGIEVLGSMSILIQGKKAGLIDQVAPDLERLRISGYWLSQDLVDRVLRMVGELK